MKILRKKKAGMNLLTGFLVLVAILGVALEDACPTNNDEFKNCQICFSKTVATDMRCSRCKQGMLWYFAEKIKGDNEMRLFCISVDFEKEKLDKTLERCAYLIAKDPRIDQTIPRKPNEKIPLQVECKMCMDAIPDASGQICIKDPDKIPNATLPQCPTKSYSVFNGVVNCEE